MSNLILKCVCCQALETQGFPFPHLHHTALKYEARKGPRGETTGRASRSKVFPVNVVQLNGGGTPQKRPTCSIEPSIYSMWVFSGHIANKVCRAKIGRVLINAFQPTYRVGTLSFGCMLTRMTSFRLTCFHSYWQESEETKNSRVLVFV